MKNLPIALITALFLSLIGPPVMGQEAKQYALVVKKTATWCSNCGSWGWTWFKDLIQETQNDQVIAIALHSTASALEVPNNLDDDWLASFSTVGGFPTFYVNGTNHSTYGSLLSTAKSKATEAPLAGIAVETGFEQDRVFARARVTWQQGVQGEYALGFYVVEDSLVHAQTSQGPNALHRFVLRRSLGNASFGETRQIDAPSGQSETWEGEQDYPLASVSRHHILAVLWRKVSATKFEYVNATLAPLEEGLLSGGVSVNTEKPFRVFPNPVQRGGQLNLEFPSASSDPVRLGLYRPNGELLHEADLPVGPMAGWSLPDRLNPGSYILSLRNREGEAVSTMIQVLD